MSVIYRKYPTGATATVKVVKSSPLALILVATGGEYKGQGFVILRHEIWPTPEPNSLGLIVFDGKKWKFTTA
jgi:hypothetical protein